MGKFKQMVLEIRDGLAALQSRLPEYVELHFAGIDGKTVEEAKDAILLDGWVGKYREDPLYRTYRILDDVSGKVCSRMQEDDIDNIELANRAGVYSIQVLSFMGNDRRTTLEDIVRIAHAVGLEVDVTLRPMEDE